MQITHMGKNIEIEIGNLLENMMVAPDGRIVCTTCHDIHQKERRSNLLVAPVPELCSICHEDKLGIPDSIHDPGTAEWAKELDFVSKGSCIDCHPIHNPLGEGGIWTSIGGYSTQLQSCENCHRAGAPGPAMETPHMGKTLGSDVQNLPTNMQVNPEKRILCTTCHDIHQKEQGPKLLSSPRENSGVCLVCHPQAGSIVGTLHDLRISASDTRYVRGKSAAESGPCGSCHLVQRNSDTGGLWAQGSIFQGKPRKGSPGGYGSGLCTNCHRENKCASGRIPNYLDHPEIALVNKTNPSDPGYMPTFDKRGQPSRTGAISCLTCHEPHNAPSITGVKEGLSPHTRMFLRPAAHKGICVDCHGAEALWRFLYYHKEHRNPHVERHSNP